MMLSVAIIAVLTGVSLPVFQSFQTRSDLLTNSQKTADALRRAQTYARSANYDSPWGVYIQSGAVTLYKGTAYGSRDTTYDETFTMPAWLTVSSSVDTSFAKLTGTPTTASSVVLSIASGSSRTISVNGEGMVSY